MAGRHSRRQGRGPGGKPTEEDYQSDPFYTLGAIGTITEQGLGQKGVNLSPKAALKEISQVIGTYEHQRHVRREAGLVPGVFEEAEE